MCVKFTAMVSWRKVHDFSLSLSVDAAHEIVTCRPMSNLPVIVLDKESGRRAVVPMR